MHALCLEEYVLPRKRSANEYFMRAKIEIKVSEALKPTFFPPEEAAISESLLKGKAMLHWIRHIIRKSHYLKR